MNLRIILFAAAALPAFALPAAAQAPDVVASIKPVRSLVAQVMRGVGEPALLVDGAASPHTYSLKPSDAAALEEAEVIFWVGEALEPFLVKPVETLGGEARVVELSRTPGLETLPYREGGPFEAEEHEAEAGSEDHAAEERDGHEEEAQRAHGEIDMHFWLDPENAKVLIGEIERTLGAADPANADRYSANAKTAIAGLDRLQAEIAAELAPVREKPFVVFHDAYQYFEKRFGLNAAGSITVSPEVAPGAQRVAEIRETVSRLGAVCVFAEPQFEPDIVATVIEGTDARSGVLDPEGADIPNGPELYPTLMRNLAKSLVECLSSGN